MPLFSSALSYSSRFWATYSEISCVFGKKLLCLQLNSLLSLLPAHSRLPTFILKSFFPVFTVLLKVYSIRLLYENHTNHSLLKLSCSTLDDTSGCCGTTFLRFLETFCPKEGVWALPFINFGS